MAGISPAWLVFYC